MTRSLCGFIQLCCNPVFSNRMLTIRYKQFMIVISVLVIFDASADGGDVGFPTPSSTPSLSLQSSTCTIPLAKSHTT
uniref:Uncharacterized protein n=1 Tax=mine drainage metagenome TaxID=410659 RepID=E6QND3_9ZZZZ